MSPSPEAPCPLCGGTEYQPVTQTATVSVYVCRICGLSRTVPRHTAAATELYTPDYHRQHSYLADPLNERVARMRLDMLHRLKPATRTFLDVGCATGYAVQIARDYGWESYGTDISEFATDYARRERHLTGIYTGSLIEARLPSHHFDIIYCHHVLEHLPDPLENLREMHRLLKPEGILFISVPNLHSVKHWLRGNAWYTPYHLYNYDAGTLRRMIEKAGFRILKLWTDSPGFVPLRRRRRVTTVTSQAMATDAQKKAIATRSVKRGVIRAYAVAANFIADRLGWGDNLNVLATLTDSTAFTRVEFDV